MAELYAAPFGLAVAAVPHGWRAAGTLHLASVDGGTVSVWCERVDDGTALAAYAEQHENLAFAAAGDGACTEQIETSMIAGAPTRSRLVAWTRADGTAMTSLVASSCHAGWGVRANVTTPSPTFAETIAAALVTLASLAVPDGGRSSSDDADGRS